MNCECELNFEYYEFAECITSALDAHDPYTGEHSRRVSDMAFFAEGCVYPWRKRRKYTLQDIFTASEK